MLEHKLEYSVGTILESRFDEIKYVYLYTNCYFLKNKENGETLIIDPADSPNRMSDRKSTDILFGGCAGCEGGVSDPGLRLSPGGGNAPGAVCKYDRPHAEAMLCPARCISG